jgi:hypothetical protein
MNTQNPRTLDYIYTRIHKKHMTIDYLYTWIHKKNCYRLSLYMNTQKPGP